MASLSANGDVLAIRLVYDGPPESGKTSSLRALAGSLSRQLESPEEAGGRTLYFDWVEYTGGSFDGLPIRCQIVSVPGQNTLASRREILRMGADAFVFVADTTRSRFAASEESLAALRSLLQDSAEPHAGIVVQANKRDHAEALPIAELHSGLALNGVAVIESVAIAGTGIREAFVLAVRLALDRVRELKSSGALRIGRPEAESAKELLQQVQAIESGRFSQERRVVPRPEPPAEAAPEPTLAAGALREILAAEGRETRAAGALPVAAPPASPSSQESATMPTESKPPGMPRLPNSDVPSGRVWPPIEGRILLHAASASAATPQVHADGSWRAQDERWWFHSAAEHEFSEVERGKEELLRWAQLHAGNLPRLSPRRCLVLSESAPKQWRLWQILQPQGSLRQRLALALRNEAPPELARTLLSVCDSVLHSRRLFAAEPVLPCFLEVIGEGPAHPLYVGLLPTPSWAAPELEGETLALLRRLIGPSIRRGLAEASIDVPQVLNAMRSERILSGERAQLIDLLATLLIGS